MRASGIVRILRALKHIFIVIVVVCVKLKSVNIARASLVKCLNIKDHFTCNRTMTALSPSLRTYSDYPSCFYALSLSGTCLCVWALRMIRVLCARPTSSQSPRSTTKGISFIRFFLGSARSNNFPAFKRSREREPNIFSNHPISLWYATDTQQQRKQESKWNHGKMRGTTSTRSRNSNSTFAAWTERNARVYKSGLGSCLCPRKFHVFSFSRTQVLCIWARACTERRRKKTWTTTQMLHI